MSTPITLLYSIGAGVVLVGIALFVHTYTVRKGSSDKKKASQDTEPTAQKELLSLAAHQLRTPLSVIDWYSDSLLSGSVGPLNEKQQKYIEQIYDAGQHTLKLVNMLLNTSRLESGKFAFVPEPANLTRLVNEVLSGLSAQIGNKKLAVRKEFEDNIPVVRIDKNFMQIVVQNVLLNAIHYTRAEGSIWIILKQIAGGTRIEKQLISADSVLLSIQDTGIGIPTGQQNRVFSRLFRADNAKEHRASGTGLGLYIAKSIIDQLDGQIWFTSEENVGTTFYVAIPVRQSAQKSTE